MAARQQALAAQKTWREQRAAVEKRREGWALDVAVAIAERDLCEQRVGIGLAKLVDDGLSLEVCGARLAELLASLAPVLGERLTEGRIRDGHGDLHAGNVCFLADRVIGYDCIEFDPALR